MDVHAGSRRVAFLLGLLVVTAAARADSVASGSFNISGSTTLTSTSIPFGSVLISSPLTGPFASLSGSTTVASVSLASPATSNWIQLSDGINFNLTGFDPGSGTNTNCSNSSVGTICTPTGTPFTFTQEPGGTVTLTFSAVGNAYSGSLSGGSSPFMGLFTAQIAGTIPSLITELDGSGLPTSYAATITTTAPASVTPEPGTLISSMTGLLLIGWRVAERKRWVRKN